jgi:hypothetical protein
LTDRLTVRDMARGLPVGGSRSGLLCPACGGGRSRERSLSVYRNEFGVGGRCHRASCPLNVFRPDIVTRDVTVAEFKPRPYPLPLAYPGPGHFIWSLLRAQPSPELAAKLGVLTNAENASEVVWEVRDYQWATRGHISRTYPDKRIRVWRDQEGPFHGYHGFKRTRVLWVVEDMVSAAQIAMLGGNALALLGTNFSANGQAELRGYLTRIHATVGYPEVKVALDPDAADKGARLARELTSRIGCATMYVPLSADPKDLPKGELARLVRET